LRFSLIRFAVYTSIGYIVLEINNYTIITHKCVSYTNMIMPNIDIF
jgi:hypothetical protein